MAASRRFEAAKPVLNVPFFRRHQPTPFGEFTTMHGLPKDSDLSFFVGKRLDTISFAEYGIFFNFDDKVSVTLESSFQHQTNKDVEQHRLGVTQSVPVAQSTLMQLVGRSVVSASAIGDGSLALVFDDGQVLRFLEDPVPYESYQFADGKHLYYVV